MNYNEWASIGYENGWMGVRKTDPKTSEEGSKSIKVRAGSQRALLLGQYFMAHDLTDEEAGQMSRLADLPKCGYWKRCSELRQAGYIEPTGETRLAGSGALQAVCKITEAGVQALGEAEKA